MCIAGWWMRYHITGATTAAWHRCFSEREDWLTAHPLQDQQRLQRWVHVCVCYSRPATATDLQWVCNVKSKFSWRCSTFRATHNLLCPHRIKTNITLMALNATAIKWRCIWLLWQNRCHTRSNWVHFLKKFICHLSRLWEGWKEETHLF